MRLEIKKLSLIMMTLLALSFLFFAVFAIAAANNAAIYLSSTVKNFQAYLVQISKDNRFLYSIIATLLMGFSGLAVGGLMELLLKTIGFKVKRINHDE